MHKRFVLYTTLAALILLVVAPTVLAQFTPDVFVVEQPVIDGNVKVGRVITNGPGWIVIHADNDGAPGAVIGQAQLQDGINAQISVAIDINAATDTLHAMLHVDEGEVGTYEFPDGPDLPLQINDQVITRAFQVTSIESTIVGVAANAGTFNTLLAAADAAGLISTLSGAGPLTVFAPIDDAFAALPEGTVEALLEDPVALADILNYHVVSGSTMSGDLTNGIAVETIQGSSLVVAIDDNGTKVGDANIITADVEAYNGVVHVIDAVLMPPVEEEAAEEEAAAEEAIAEVVDIVDTAIAAGNFGTLAAALEATALIDTLKSEGPFTVFAPTDDAFGELPEGTLEVLLNEPDTLSQILLFHVVPGVVLSTDLTNGLEAETAQGSTVVFSFDADGNAMVNGAAIIVADIEASNGVIHVIDRVILPDLGAAAEEATVEEVAEEEALVEEFADIFDTAIAADDFELFVATVVAADLAEMLKGDGPFTIFAPTDEAFASLPEGTLEALLQDPAGLAEILLYHVVPGRLFAADLSGGLEAATAQGATVTFTLDGGAMINDANIIITDIEASNGVIHVIDAVILPPAADGEEVVEEEAVEEEPTEEEAVAEEEPTTMPTTGGDIGSVAMTIFAVFMTMLMIAGFSFVDKRRNMNA